MIYRIGQSLLVTISIWIVVGAVCQQARSDEEFPNLRRYRNSVDRAVDMGLRYLVRNQVENSAHDGSFTGTYGETTAVPGLVGMAFLAKGYRPGSPPYGEVINRTIDYILSKQQPNGYLGTGGRSGMYEQGIATLYLSEVSGMVDPARQKEIDALLPKALRIILDAQKVPKDFGGNGGWKYSPVDNQADISVSGWNLMALRSARQAGAPVPDEAIKKAMMFINSCRQPDGGFSYGARWKHSRSGRFTGGGSGPGRTGVGLLCRFVGGQHGTEYDNEINRKAGDYLLRFFDVPNPTESDNIGHVEYTIYYCSQAMFQLGGHYWERYAEFMYRYLLKNQDNDGAWRTEQGGDIYPTAMYVLALSVSYRQLPIYQR